jgi:hypothetical protein
MDARERIRLKREATTSYSSSSPGDRQVRRRCVMNRMRNLATITAIVVPGVLAGATPAVAADTELAPTPPPKGPPVVYEDPAGDVDESVPDLISCAASEPWESLLSFRLEFAAAPPLSYDMETMTTDELWLMLLSGPEADPLTDSDQIEYAMIVHGATLPAEEETGSGLFDTTQPEGQEVFWRVVDVDVEGAVLTLSIDRKLVGDPEVVYFVAGVTSEGQEESGYDACPDLDTGPGAYELVGA